MRVLPGLYYRKKPISCWKVDLLWFESKLSNPSRLRGKEVFIHDCKATTTDGKQVAYDVNALKDQQ
jgi:hypothetical protein